MTGPETPGVPARTVISGPLANPGPAQSAMLIHFTGRPGNTTSNRGLPRWIVDGSPAERLSSILWDGTLYGQVPYGGTLQAVSLSEASPDHVSWLVNARGFPPWGLIVGRQAVYDAGGGPVWYARRDQYEALRGTPAAEWTVRYEATPDRRSGWTHEQEWRLHGAQLDLRALVPIGVLVGDPGWQPIQWQREPVNAESIPHGPGPAVAEYDVPYVPGASALAAAPVRDQRRDPQVPADPILDVNREEVRRCSSSSSLSAGRSSRSSSAR